jgi:hypothetical protein
MGLSAYSLTIVAANVPIIVPSALKILEIRIYQKIIVLVRIYGCEKLSVRGKNIYGMPLKTKCSRRYCELSRMRQVNSTGHLLSQEFRNLNKSPTIVRTTTFRRL